MRLPAAALILGLAGSVIPQAPMLAQDYYRPEYAEAVRLLALPSSESMDIGQTRIWVTFHLTRSGYLLVLVTDHAAEGTSLHRWWLRNAQPQLDSADPARCHGRRLGTLVGVCMLEWPTQVSPSELGARFADVGLFPLPDTLGLRPRNEPCPDDGWHLWVQHRSDSGYRSIEWCVPYVWPDEDTPRRAIEILEGLIREALPPNTRLESAGR
jgi:hypothetical protein